MKFSSLTLFASLLLSSSNGEQDGEIRLELSPETVHWGYFSKSLTPIVTVPSGTELTVEMATHHACDDWDKMIKGDAGMESIFLWDEVNIGVEFRGATGGGDGVHILTGPIYVEDAEPGDILKVEILDLEARKNAEGKSYGSNAAAWWGYQARVNKADGRQFTAGSFTATPDQNDELVTIYEFHDIPGEGTFAVPSYQFEWPTIIDPQGNMRDYIAYPGTCVPHDNHGNTVFSGEVQAMGWTKVGNITYYDSPFRGKIPVQFHVGCMGLAPSSHDAVDSIPPMPSGGNLDNRRIGVGTTMYYPVEVAGGLLSMGDAHTAQGDSELDGTGIETSITGRFRITVIKAADFTPAQQIMDFPLGETSDTWIVHAYTETDYLETYFDNPAAIYDNSNVDKTGENAFTQTRKFLMAQYDITEAEAWSFISLGVDFGITQLVDGNWGIHAVIYKSMFPTATDGSTAVAIAATEGGGGARKLQGDTSLDLKPENVHWGYWSNELEPVLTVSSGSDVVVEMASHHACDDYDLMIKGDAGMESIYLWNSTTKAVSWRGAQKNGDGTHILTGPIYVEGAEPGDIIQVEILDLAPRSNLDGKIYGSNAASHRGYQSQITMVNGSKFRSGSLTTTPGQNDEVVTIYEIKESSAGRGVATPVYQFGWPTITDPMGTSRDYMSYPGTCVPHTAHGDFTPSSTVAAWGWSANRTIRYVDDVYPAQISLVYHVGAMGLAPATAGPVDSTPPMVTGGNLDNKRIGVGTTMYYPVEVAGGLLSMGDGHAAQGDSEFDGSGIETSLTGKFRITLIKSADFTPAQASLDFPLGETKKEWIVHGFSETNYLEKYASDPSAVFEDSSLDKATMNCFTQTRKFLMAQYGLTEYEAWTLITQGVDFAITQAVNGNWGVHTVIPKAVFDDPLVIDEGPPATQPPSNSGAVSTTYVAAAFIAVLGLAF